MCDIYVTKFSHTPEKKNVSVFGNREALLFQKIYLQFGSFSSTIAECDIILNLF